MSFRLRKQINKQVFQVRFSNNIPWLGKANRMHLARPYHKDNVDYHQSKLGSFVLHKKWNYELRMWCTLQVWISTLPYICFLLTADATSSTICYIIKGSISLGKFFELNFMRFIFSFFLKAAMTYGHFIYVTPCLWLFVEYKTYTTSFLLLPSLNGCCTFHSIFIARLNVSSSEGKRWPGRVRYITKRTIEHHLE